MKAYKSIVFTGLIGAACLLSAVPSVHAQSANYGGSYSGDVTVRQGIKSFADRYGDIVIPHGRLNLDSRIASNFMQGEASGQAAAFLASAAGARSIRVYFVTPATHSQSVTNREAAARLVHNTGSVNFRLKDLAASSAITSLAAADNAVVRFPDGAPQGTVSLTATNMPLDRAISEVAQKTHTHWSVGFIFQSNNSTMPMLPALNSTQTMASLPSDRTANPAVSAGGAVSVPAYAPGTSGDSSAATAAATPQATSGDSSAAAPDNSSRKQVAEALPPGYGPGAIVIQGDTEFQLPPEKPLPKDAEGNILPITVHITPPPPVPANTTGRSYNNTFYDPSQSLGGMTDFPTTTALGDLNPADPGTVEAYQPSPYTTQNGLNFVPNSVAFGPGGYGGGFTSSYPQFFTY